MIVRFYYPREFEKERQGIMRRIPSYHDHGSIEEENSSQGIEPGRCVSFYMMVDRVMRAYPIISMSSLSVVWQRYSRRRRWSVEGDTRC
jgi:hypothetical protein